MARKTIEGGSIASRAVALLCFAALAFMASRRANPSSTLLLLSAASGFLAAWVFMKTLGVLLYTANSPLRTQYGWAGVKRVMGRGFVMMLPFTVLAMVAEFRLGWNATQAFTSAGIMAASSAMGADMIQLGGRRLPSLLLPMLGAVTFSMLWMAMSSALQVALR